MGNTKEIYIDTVESMAKVLYQIAPRNKTYNMVLDEIFFFAEDSNLDLPDVFETLYRIYQRANRYQKAIY